MAWLPFSTSVLKAKMQTSKQALLIQLGCSSASEHNSAMQATGPNESEDPTQRKRQSPVNMERPGTTGD
jgi:hypothetical protein